MKELMDKLEYFSRVATLVSEKLNELEKALSEMSTAPIKAPKDGKRRVVRVSGRV
jgi:hypothetical protein